MGKFKFQKYDQETNAIIGTNVAPNPDGSDTSLYIRSTELKDGNGKDIYDLDIIERKTPDFDSDRKDRGVVISQLNVYDKNGTDKKVDVAIFDGGVELLDNSNVGEYIVRGNILLTPHLMKV